jgi:ABC-2 type transport system permease protein
MRNAARVLLAVVRRDALVAFSYRTWGIFSVLAGFFSLWLLYFLGRTFGAAPALATYGGDYFRFAVVGTALASVARGGIAGVTQRVRESQLDGSLGYLLSTPARAPLVLCGLALYPIASAFVGAALYLAGAAWFFGADFSAASIGPALVASLAGVVASLGLGMVSSANVLIIRRSDPLSWVLESSSLLLSGVLYPVEALPVSLQRIAQLLPATHAISAVRASLVRHASLADIAPDLLALLAITAVTLPMGLFAARFALARVERDGSAGHS